MTLFLWSRESTGPPPLKAFSFSTVLRNGTSPDLIPGVSRLVHCFLMMIPSFPPPLFGLFFFFFFFFVFELTTSRLNFPRLSFSGSSFRSRIRLLFSFSRLQQDFYLPLRGTPDSILPYSFSSLRQVASFVDYSLTPFGLCMITFKVPPLIWSPFHASRS